MREWHPTGINISVKYLDDLVQPKCNNPCPTFFKLHRRCNCRARDSVSRTCRKRESFPPDTIAFPACKCVKQSFVPCDARRDAWHFSEKRYTAPGADASQTRVNSWIRIPSLSSRGDAGSGKHNSVYPSWKPRNVYQP